MAIKNIQQPDVIQIDESIRLRRFDGVYDFALSWYQDVELVWMVDGDRIPYTPELLQKMYTYLDNAGELYFIEALEEDSYRPIGDVTFWQEDMPIVIADPAYRGKGIGSKTIARLIQRGRELGYEYLCVDEIYRWNEVSQKCFESFGFCAYEKTEKGARYKLIL